MYIGEVCTDTFKHEHIMDTYMILFAEKDADICNVIYATNLFVSHMINK